jgi:hypothetical protein
MQERFHRDPVLGIVVDDQDARLGRIRIHRFPSLISSGGIQR